ncbi:MAG TPA: PIN domain-containing protein [Micromonosporaceae bacterium]|jgi:rRNA-processing protein FCF1
MLSMHIDPLPGVQRDNLGKALSEQANRLQDAKNVHGSAADRLLAYLRWATDAGRALSTMLRQEDVRRLVLTDQFRLLLSAGPGLIGADNERQRTLNGLVIAETDARTADLEAAGQDLERRIQRWAFTGICVMADTNFYMEHQDRFDEIDFRALLHGHTPEVLIRGHIRLLIPLAVIDELDAQKRRNEARQRARARCTLAIIDGLFPKPDAQADLWPTKDKQRIGDPITAELLFDPPNHVRLPRTDEEIIDRLIATEPVAGRDIYLITYDTNMSMRARRAGVHVVKLVEPEKPPSRRQERRDKTAAGSPSRLQQ